MKTTIIITIFCILNTNAQKSSEIENDKILINNYLKNIILSTNDVSKENYDTYLDIFKKSQEGKNKTFEWINFYNLACRESIRLEEWKDYKILHYDEAKINEKVNSSVTFKNLKYRKKDNIYFVIFDNNNERVLFFITKNDKIISYFSRYIRFNNSDPIIPYFLNKNPKKIEAINVSNKD